jgi:cellulose biosynthesis protein BcsQ
VKVLATHNIKGGVGKTATAINLSYLSARDGLRTLVWDLDPQAAATFYFRVRPKKGGGRRIMQGKENLERLIVGTDFQGLDLLRAHFSFRNMDLALDRTKHPATQLRRLLKPLAEDYDCIILDCPPGISLAAESIFFAAHALLVPTIPTTLSLRSLAQLSRYIEKRSGARARILPFFCMVDLRKNMHRRICEHTNSSHGFLGTRIPYSSAIEQMGAYRAPLNTYASGSLADRAYRSLWGEVKNRVGLMPP